MKSGAACRPYRQNVWDCLEELHELGESVVAELALPAKVVVVGWDELAERHPAVWLMPKKVHHLLRKLLGSLHFLHGPLWRPETGFQKKSKRLTWWKENGRQFLF